MFYVARRALIGHDRVSLAHSLLSTIIQPIALNLPIIHYFRANLRHRVSLFSLSYLEGGRIDATHCHIAIAHFCEVSDLSIHVIVATILVEAVKNAHVAFARKASVLLLGRDFATRIRDVH